MKSPAGGAKFLDNQEMLKIHQTMLAILEDPGMEVELPDYALKRLADGGARVDVNRKRVYLSPDLVLETIRQVAGAATPEITVEGTAKPPQPFHLPSRLRATVGSTHGFIFDVDKWAIRDATHEDARNFMKIRRSLQHVYPYGVGMLPQDVPVPVQYIHRAALSAKYDEEPEGGYANGPDDAPWVTRVLQAAGVLGDDAPPATSVHVQPTGALRISGRVAEDMLHAVEAGRLSWLAPCGFMGGNHPVTIPGALAQVYAEYFGSNTVVRLLVPAPNNVFTPRAVGCDHLIMDLRRGAFVGSSPEALHLRMCMRQMSGAFYKFPNGSGFISGTTTDAKVPGIQAAMEHATWTMAELMCGFYSYEEEVVATVKTLGRLHANLCLCAEQVIIDHEMFQWMQQFFKGIEVNEETLALEGIREVGPGGEFTSSEHTLRNYREHMWFPALLHRGAWADWVDGGALTPLDIAKERVKDILQQELVPVLPDDKCREVDRVVQAAEKALLGTTTGVLP